MRSIITLIPIFAATAAPAPQDPLMPAPSAPVLQDNGAQTLGINTSCPDVMVLAARETTAPPGFGSAITLSNLVLQAFPGTSAAQAIDYPAAGGDNAAYAASVATGIAAVVSQLGSFAAQCPESLIVMHGYSQGAQIMDDAFCGGPDGTSLTTSQTLVPEATAAKVAALIFMGDPRHVAGEPFNVGNATAGGFAARPEGFSCPEFASRIVSFCDAPDPFCAKGNDPATHQGYGSVYGQQALDFVVSKIGEKKEAGSIANVVGA